MQTQLSIKPVVAKFNKAAEINRSLVLLGPDGSTGLNEPLELD